VDPQEQRRVFREERKKVRREKKKLGEKS